LSLKDEGFVWNTPKKRRSLEVRKRKSFGLLEWGTYKKLRLNKRILVDHKSGRYYEMGKMELESFKQVP
jgi:hypothetical protein